MSKKVIFGINDLSTVNSKLALEWHPTKNGDLRPEQVRPFSNKQVWWICEKGHEWQATINHRSNGRGCPICAGRKVLPGFNDLITVNNRLALEWHPTKNGNLRPEHVTSGSHKQVWWKCKKGHEWRATVNDRSSGKGCPICSGRDVLTGFNDLVTINPKLASEWHPTKNGDLKPERVSVSSGKKVWWLCEKGHEWQSAISNRSSGKGCPVCSGKKVLPGFNDITTINPKLASEWHPTKNGTLKPEHVTSGSEKKVWWLCEKGHEWQAVIYSRSGGSGCPICSGRDVLQGFNDLASRNPKLAGEWHPTKNGTLKPEQVTVSSNKKVWWVCKKGHEWRATIDHRSKGNGCPKCAQESQTSFAEKCVLFYIKKSNKFETMVENCKLWKSQHSVDIFIEDIKTAIEYDGEYFHNTFRDLKKDKLCEAEGITLIRLREKNCLPYESNSIKIVLPSNDIKGLEFGICELLRVLKIDSVNVNIIRDQAEIDSLIEYSEKENSLAILCPQLASEWHPTKNGTLKPEHVTSCSNKKVWWECKNGHEWRATVDHRSHGNRCPICSGREVLQGFNDLATVNPKLTNEWHPTKNGTLKPEHVLSGSHEKVWWICEKGHEWQAAIYSRSAGKGCPACRGKSVMCVETGQIFNSIKEAAEFFNIKGSTQISSAAAGKRKTAGKYHWKYVEE